MYNVPLLQPIPESQLVKDLFSGYVGKIQLGLHTVSIFEVFLVLCFKSKALHCTKCQQPHCKCSHWTKCIHTVTSFSLKELRNSADNKTLNAFFTRAQRNISLVDDDCISSFEDAPLLSAEKKMDQKLLNINTFRQALISGITTKTVMAWRALQLCYLQESDNLSHSPVSESTISLIISTLFPPSVEITNSLFNKISPIQRRGRKRPIHHNTPIANIRKTRPFLGADENTDGVPISVRKPNVLIASPKTSPIHWKRYLNSLGGHLPTEVNTIEIASDTNIQLGMENNARSSTKKQSSTKFAKYLSPPANV